MPFARRGSSRSTRRRAETRSQRGPVAYRIAKAALNRPLRAAYQVDVQGLENVPADEGVILAANHRSFMDSIFLALASPEPVAFVAKAEYFENPMTRWLFRATGQIPLKRGSPAGAREALAAATGAAIVPVGLVGTDQVQLPEERLPHLFRPVAVRFGAARRLPAPDGKASARRLRATTDEVMQDIAALSGAEYVDSFA